MIIISKTPVRISFFGGGTDYPQYYLRAHGAVLGTTINKYTYISINTPSDFFDHKVRISYSKTELIKSLEEIEHPSVRECLRFKDAFRNLDIHIFSDLPARTGLGSSSSFTVGFLNALYALEGQKISHQQLAEEAIHVEQNLIGENVGSQDPFHASYGGFNLIEFTPSHIHIRPLIISREKVDYLQNHVMLFYTGLTRHASEVLEEQIQKTLSEANDLYLEEMRHLVYEAEKTFAQPKEQMILALGSLLHQSWVLKKRLSTQISTPLIDEAYQRARNAGALGGKLCGAGSGGFLALLVPPAKQPLVHRALSHFVHVPVRLENEGSSVIYMKD